VRQEYCVKEKKNEPVPMEVDSEKVPAAPSTIEDEELVDHEAFPERTSMEINVVHFLTIIGRFRRRRRHIWTLGPAKLYFRSPKIRITT